MSPWLCLSSPLSEEQWVHQSGGWCRVPPIARRLMCITINSMSTNAQHTDNNISRWKSFQFLDYFPLFRKRYSHAQFKTLFLTPIMQLTKLLSPSSSPLPRINSTETNLVAIIPSDLPLTEPERSVLMKGFKFVLNFGPIDLSFQWKIIFEVF